MGARIHGGGVGSPRSLQVERPADPARDGAGGFALEHEPLGRRALDALRPEFLPIRDAYQPGRHQHPVVPALQASVDDVLDAQVARDPIHRRPRAFVVHRRGARHHTQKLWIQPAQLRDGLLRQPINRGILVRIAALILERQHEQLRGRGRACGRHRLRTPRAN